MNDLWKYGKWLLHDNIIKWIGEEKIKQKYLKICGWKLCTCHVVFI